MPNQPSLQALEETEQFIDHVLALVNQADQELQQAQQAIENFMSAHPDAHSSTHHVKDAIHGLKDTIGSFTNAHNELVGKINEAKAHASQEDDPYANQ